ncbi:MAG: DUF6232 family protein [Terriglobia bacterium]
MKEEITFYSDGHGVRVTSARLIIGDTTFSLANITSVRKISTNPDRRGPLKFMVIAVGVLFLAIALESGVLAFGAVVMGGLGVLWWKGQRPVYELHIASASGETAPLKSDDKNRVEKIVQAINEAMIQR